MNDFIGAPKNKTDDENSTDSVKPKSIPVPKTPVNPVFVPKPTAETVSSSSLLSVPSFTEPTPVVESTVPSVVQNGPLRIEKIEIPPPSAEETDTTLEDTPPTEYVTFRIYSPYYEVYQTLLTGDYFRSIGLDMDNEGVMTGGGENPTFPYNLFQAVFNNTFGRLAHLFQPKKDGLAEEQLKQSDTFLSQVSSFKTEELLKPLDEKTPILTPVLSPTAEKLEEYTPSPEQPPYFEIKFPKVGPVLSLKEYNEQKRLTTNDEMLEHDETGKTFQEILLEAKQDEIQQERKRALLVILEQHPHNILQVIERLETEDAVNEKTWFIRQQVLDSDEREPVYKIVKLNLSIVH